MSAQNFQFKVVLLGEGCVGKTSLMIRYVNDQFNEKHLSTIQAAFMKKKIKIGGYQTIELAIWDTAGQERYHALGPIYYRGSNGAFLVYDITDIDSFQRIKSWVKELRTSLGNDCILSIVGNKSDLEKDRNVSLIEAEEYSKSVGAKHYSTSAKFNQGVNELFVDISKRMVENLRIQNQAKANNSGSTGSNRKNIVQIVDDTNQIIQEKQSNCC